MPDSCYHWGSTFTSNTFLTDGRGCSLRWTVIGAFSRSHSGFVPCLVVQYATTGMPAIIHRDQRTICLYSSKPDFGGGIYKGLRVRRLGSYQAPGILKHVL